jgi:hypothetical protein
MSKIKLDETIFSIRRLLMTILWPSFIMACVSSVTLFSLVDPENITLHSNTNETSNAFIYSIGFFVVWLLGAMTSALTALLMCKTR